MVQTELLKRKEAGVNQRSIAQCCPLSGSPQSHRHRPWTGDGVGNFSGVDSVCTKSGREEDDGETDRFMKGYSPGYSPAAT